MTYVYKNRETGLFYSKTGDTSCIDCVFSFDISDTTIIERHNIANTEFNKKYIIVPYYQESRKIKLEKINKNE